MTIDIIAYTDAQYALLTEEQLQEVKEAQIRKNRLQAALEEKLVAERHKLAQNGILLSEIFALRKEQLQAEYEREVEWIRDGLLFYLRFGTKVEDVAHEYEIDYSLTMEQRYYVVRDYYMEKYTDPVERFNVFVKDEVAIQYLGENYATLYDYLLMKKNAAVSQ